MDADAIAATVRKQLASQYAAAEAVRGVLGKVDALAYDSADSIYADAIAKMGIKGIPASAAKYVFAAIQTVKTPKEGAMDSAPKTASTEDFLKKFIR